MPVLDLDVVIGRTRADNADHVIDRLRALGFDPNGSCRFMSMCRALHKGFLHHTHPDFRTALEAERDMQLLAFILDQDFARHDNPRFCDKVNLLLHDSVLPQEDRGESKGRNAQFELYAAAICQNAGLVPVIFDEPDIACVVSGLKFGIAAKRIKHLQQLRKRVKDAADQIARSKLPGIVAIDASLALNSDNQPMVSPLQNQMFEMSVRAMGDWFFREHQRDIEKAVKSKGVRGVLISHSIVRHLPGAGWILNGMTFWHSTAAGDYQAQTESESFYDSFCRGIPNLTDIASD